MSTHVDSSLMLLDEEHGAIVSAEAIHLAMPSSIAEETINGNLSECYTPHEHTRHAGMLRGETLAGGMLLLVVLTVAQRLVGFVRSLLFCRWLEPKDLGHWDLTLGFLTLAAPLVVLGLPGSFGRYVEHYWQNGHLKKLILRTAWACLALIVLAGGLMLLAGDITSWIVYDKSGLAAEIPLLTAVLSIVIAWNYLVSLFTAMRQMRVVSLMQMANSIVFAVASIALVVYWRADGVAVVAAYGLACLVTTILGIVSLARMWPNIQESPAPLPQQTMWRRLLPFAGWVWLVNLLSNLFEVVDRYLIIHSPALTTEQAEIMVGNFHSCRVVPTLMVGVACLFSSMVLPHLSHDWEAGRRRKVSDDLNLTLKLGSLGFILGALILLVCSPILFGWAFNGKYDGGLAALPWSLVFCAWLSLGLVAQNYLWVAEKAGEATFAYAVGLLVNILLNVLLLPIYGLIGVAIATAVANGVALAYFLVLGRRHGMRMDPAACLLCALPVAVGFGIWPTVIGLSIVAILGWKTTAIFSLREKQLLGDVLQQGWKKLGFRA